MNNKRPWYKSGYKWALIMLFGMFVTASRNTKTSAECLMIALFLTIGTFLKRLIVDRKREKKYAKYPAEGYVPEQAQAMTNNPSSTITAATTSDGIQQKPATVKASTSTRLWDKAENHRVAGTSFHREAIESIGKYNTAYDMTAAELRDIYSEWDRVYEYEFFPSKVELVPEPENEHDSNAIRVEVDGHHIGYIKHGSTTHIRKLMQEDRIVSISAELGGGKYKQLDDEGHLSKDKTEYFAKLTLKITDKAATTTTATSQSKKKAIKPSDDNGRVCSFKVAGISHYQEAVEGIGLDNLDYDLSEEELLENHSGEQVYEKEFYSIYVDLIHEPDNPYDHNAIRVEADDVMIGYVPKDKTDAVLRRMSDRRKYEYDIEIVGGNYKLMSEDGLECGEDEYTATVTIKPLG